MNKSETGRLGERCAAAYLRKKGLRILAANYYSRYGEIDLIAANEQYLVFVEVKTRMEDGFGTPAEAVTRTKQKKIVKTALCYLMAQPSELQPRFDILEVTLCQTPAGVAVKSCNHLENAFDAS